MIRRYHHLSLRYLLNHKKRTGMLLTGISLAIALMAGMTTIYSSTRRHMIEAAIRDKGSHHISFTGINRKQAAMLAAHGSVAEAGTRVGYPVSTGKGRFLIEFRDPAAAAMAADDFTLLGGKLPGVGEILPEERDLKNLGISDPKRAVGKRVLLGDKHGEYTISGIARFHYYDTTTSRKLIIGGVPPGDLTGASIKLFVRLNDLRDIEQQARGLAGFAGVEETKIGYNEQFLNLFGRGLSLNINRGLKTFTFIVFAIILLATAVLIYNFFSISMTERIRDFALLRCSGADTTQIVNIILGEACIISLLAIPPGILAGTGAMPLIFTVAEKMSSHPFFSELQVTVSAAGIAGTALLSFITISLSALVPAIQGASTPPMAALRPADQPSLRRSPLISPRLPFPLLMACRNMERNPGRFLATLLSIAISICLYISFSGLLDLSIKANMIQDPEQPEFILTSPEGIEGSVIDTIAEMEEVAKIYPYQVFQTIITAEREKLTHDTLSVLQAGKGEGIPLRESRIITYGEARIDPEKPQALLIRHNAFFNEKGVKTFLPASSYQAGELLLVKTFRGADAQLMITGTEKDPLFDNYNSGAGIDIVVDCKTFAELAGERKPEQLLIKLVEGAGADPLLRYLESITESDSPYSYRDGQKLADNVTRDFRAVSLFFYGFIAMIALIGISNIANSIGTNLLLRRRGIGTLQAGGLTPRDLALMLLAEGVLLCLTGWLTGALAGSACWALLVSVASTVRGTAFTIPWKAIGITAPFLILLSLISGGLSYFYLERESIVGKLGKEE